MENTRIGKSEAIALLITITVNTSILIASKVIVSSSKSSSILNVLYISIVALFSSFIICNLLNKFPTFDILDISNFLGGKFLKFVVGIMFLTYFIFFTGILLRNFSGALRTIYFESTNDLFIMLVFILVTIFICSLRYNAIFRSNLLVLPLLMFSIIFLFVANIKNFTFMNIFPILGNGTSSTFLIGLSNLFAFQGLAHLFFLPPRLKDVTNFKKIAIISTMLSSICILLTVSSTLFLFDASVNTDELFPLYSAVTYIEFGSFFQRLDSLFILAWIISFISYLCITVKTCCNISRKILPMKSEFMTIIIICIGIYIISFVPKNYTVSTFFTNVVYKYCFGGIMCSSVSILLLSLLFRYFKDKLSHKHNFITS